MRLGLRYPYSLTLHSYSYFYLLDIATACALDHCQALTYYPANTQKQCRHAA